MLASSSNLRNPAKDTIYHESFEARRFRSKLYTQTFTKKLSRNPTYFTREQYVKLHVTMASTDDASSWTTESCVCGFHVYRDTWEPENGKLLQCFREADNPETGMQLL